MQVRISTMAKKTSLGRQKIAIAKISNKNSLHVTFSKRRTGLFKKASELSTLCGAEIALLVFSPSNKVFSFGNPDVNSVVERFLKFDHREDNKSTMSLKMLEAYSREDSVRVHNLMLVDVLNQLEQENERRKELERIKKARQAQFWWEAPVDELDIGELQKLRVSLEQLRENVKMESVKLMAMAESTNHHHHHHLAPPLNNGVWNGEFDQKHEVCVDDGHLALSQFLNFDPENVFF